ncbi:hypothetical protein HYV87_02220 [Candidatus Woesearchaeota archaeon]|nr:hypothetical protein [Candidatus Woesearchaeota archaeon]MBI2581926.1 hypothetical protein [Candidatus Woesearchaeota archaeon]
MAKKKARRSKAVRPKWHAVPLKGSFMVMSIIGFLITAYLIDDVTYKTTFMIVFIAMFIASMVSMTKAPTSE